VSGPQTETNGSEAKMKGSTGKEKKYDNRR
jgi:hypothetical protein